MAKVVCDDCGEVIAEGVDQEEAEELAEQHGHSDGAGRQAIDRTSPDETYDQPGGGGLGSDNVVNPDLSENRESRVELDPILPNDGDPIEQTADTPDLDDEIEDIEAAAENRDPSDWWDVTGDQDHTEVDDEFVRRFERIEVEIEKDRSEIGDMIEARGQSIEEGQYVRYDHEYLKDLERWQHLRDDVQDAFRRLASRNAPVASRKGSALNMKAINQRAAGDKSKTRLFTRKDQVAKGDRAVGVSADFSGSMDESKVKMALAAVAEATEIIGDNLVSNVWSCSDTGIKGVNRSDTSLGLVCGPDESFEWSNLDAFTCGGSTPTADGIDQIVGLLEDVTAREKVAIVITDGKPNKEYGGGVWGESLTGDATDDAARVVRKARQDGMKVVGLGVGGVNEAQMGRIFGETGYVMGSMDNLDRKLVEVYRQQLRVD